MENISSEYWMLIITVLVGFICFVLYEFAMLLRESKEAISDSRKIITQAESTLEKANLIVDDARSITDSLKGTVSDINEFVVGPLSRIGSVLAIVGGLFGSAKVVKK